MLKNLALNHSVVIEKQGLVTPVSPMTADELSPPAFDGTLKKDTLLNPSLSSRRTTSPPTHIEYSASSPDELALVNGARFLGVTYTGRDALNNSIFNISVKGSTQMYELLNVIEFSSARKRMTSVFREVGSGRIVVMCKGADSVLLPLVKDAESPRVKQLIDATVDHMNAFAREGLRTLLIVEKTISETEYANWAAQYTLALNSLVDRESKVSKCADALECHFELVGSTALEDKLQDGVPETIKMIRRAGVKLWVLTGDKIETAINIGYSCRLLDDQMN